MPLMGVAALGDTTATPSAATQFGGNPGAWSAGPVTETAYPNLTIGGTGVIHQASCTFTFTPTSTTITPSTSPVTLTASSTTLQKGSTNVLRAGDTTADANGNTLTVSAAHNLRSD